MSGWNQIKRDKADIDFSIYIRLKAKKCAKCGRKGMGERGIVGLQCSHFHSRRKWVTRFDEENVDILCISCHRFFTEHKTEYHIWKCAKLGQKKYDLLELRANQLGHKDFKAARIVWKKILKEFESLKE